MFTDASLSNSSQLLALAQVHDFTISDLTAPTYQRFYYVLSGLLNFYDFELEQRSETLLPLIEENAALMEREEALVQEIQDKKDMIAQEKYVLAEFVEPSGPTRRPIADPPSSFSSAAPSTLRSPALRLRHPLLFDQLLPPRNQGEAPQERAPSGRAPREGEAGLHRVRQDDGVRRRTRRQEQRDEEQAQGAAG